MGFNGERLPENFAETEIRGPFRQAWLQKSVPFVVEAAAPAPDFLVSGI